MAHSQVAANHPLLGRVGPVVAGSTVVLTLALFGLLSLSAGAAAGLSGRVPYYVLGAAVAFAAALFGLDRRADDGRNLLVAAAGIAVVTFVLLGLSSEGVVYAVRDPGRALGPRRVLYLLSAALVATGLGYWATNHVAELVRSIRGRRYRR